MWPVADAAGLEAAELQVAERRLHVAAYDVGAPVRPAPRQPVGGLVDVVVEHAAEGVPRVAGQRGGEHPGVGLVVGVRLGEAGALHLLRRLGDPHRLVAVDLGQRVVERVGRVVRVEDLLAACPSPARAAAGRARASRGRRTRCCRASTPGTPWPARSSRPGPACPRCTEIAAISAAFSACSTAERRPRARRPRRCTPRWSSRGPTRRTAGTRPRRRPASDHQARRRPGSQRLWHLTALLSWRAGRR